MTNSKPAKDPNSLKIASFRTKEGVWAEFCQKAESIGLTATDVIKASMEQFINGAYNPFDVHTSVITSIARHDNVLTRHDVLDIVNTAIGETLAKLDPHNETALEVAIARLSIPNFVATKTMIDEAIAKLEAPCAGISEQIEAEIEPLADLLAELETYTQSQFMAVREELKKPLAIVR